MIFSDVTPSRLTQKPVSPFCDTSLEMTISTMTFLIQDNNKVSKYLYFQLYIRLNKKIINQQQTTVCRSCYSVMWCLRDDNIAQPSPPLPFKMIIMLENIYSYNIYLP